MSPHPNPLPQGEGTESSSLIIRCNTLFLLLPTVRAGCALGQLPLPVGEGRGEGSGALGWLLHWSCNRFTAIEKMLHHKHGRHHQVSQREQQ